MSSDHRLESLEVVLIGADTEFIYIVAKVGDTLIYIGYSHRLYTVPRGIADRIIARRVICASFEETRGKIR